MASPTAGTAALDVFVLESLEWTDEVDDLPLLYSFSYANGQASLAPHAVVVTGLVSDNPATAVTLF